MRDNGCICSNYVSLAHGWATGPTSALTDYVLGLQSSGIGGSSWRFQPHTAGLQYAQGRIELPSGSLAASWHLDNQERLRAVVDAPRNIPGTVAVPVDSAADPVRIDGHVVWDETGAQQPGVYRDGDYIMATLAPLPGSGHRVVTITVG
jgi:hypothetical protein